MHLLEWASPHSSHDQKHVDILESPKNTLGNELESLLGNPKLDLVALNILDKAPLDPLAPISSTSATNITVREKSKSGSHHLRGCLKTKSLFQGDLYDLRDVPISSSDDFRALRASSPEGVPK